MIQSLDGYVDRISSELQFPVPGPKLFRHFIDWVGGQSGSIYGRRLYGFMRYWDEDQEGWDDEERAFAEAWRRQPKWVASRSLEEVGPNATLIRGDLEAAVRRIKDEHDGEIEVGGPELAQQLTELGLIDEYRLYFRPFVLGRGKPFFSGPRPPLSLVSSDRVGEDAVMLTYVPA